MAQWFARERGVGQLGTVVSAEEGSGQSLSCSFLPENHLDHILQDKLQFSADENSWLWAWLKMARFCGFFGLCDGACYCASFAVYIKCYCSNVLIVATRAGGMRAREQPACFSRQRELGTGCSAEKSEDVITP